MFNDQTACQQVRAQACAVYTPVKANKIVWNDCEQLQAGPQGRGQEARSTIIKARLDQWITCLDRWIKGLRLVRYFMNFFLYFKKPHLFRRFIINNVKAKCRH